MEREIEQRAEAPQTRPHSQGPISVSEAITELAACLALVKPVGMDRKSAGEWLTVAAKQIAGFQRGLVTIACDAAQRECTHHAQIVPCVIKKIGEMRPWSTLEELRMVGHERSPQVQPPEEIRQIIDSTARSLTSK